ncbi:MAG: ChaN family lipoprotein [Acidobacteriota bacterium]
MDRHTRRKYIRDFLQEYRTYRELASYDDLVVQGFRSDIIYIGDYHALPECQAFCARFLSDMILRSSHVVLALEMIFSRQQRVLDAWMEGELETSEFLHRIRYDEEWGYDWQGYQKILETARQSGIPVVGIDCEPRSGFRMIRRRDAHSAERIAEIFLRDPQAKVVVLIGESHLARRHLPLRVFRDLEKRQMESRTLTIVQNIDSMYWQRAAAGQDEVEVVRLESDRYCVFNASPITKYESYRRLIERWRAQPGDDEIDLTPTVHSMINTILTFLGLDRHRLVIRDRQGRRFKLVDLLPEVYAREEEAFLRQMMERHGLDHARIQQVMAHLKRAGSSFVPRINAIFVGTFDLTHAGEEASHFISSALKGELYEGWEGDPLADHDRFYSAVMEEAVGYFGSKLIDPARNHFFETDFYRYHDKDRELIESRTGYAFEEFKAIIDFILLHKRFERDYEHHREVPESLLAGIRSGGDRFRILTHELGYFLGQQIHDGVRQGLVTRKEILALYRQSWREPSSALSAYLDWVGKLGLPGNPGGHDKEMPPAGSSQRTTAGN